MPGVGPIVGLTYVPAIDDPGRFRSSKTAGAHSGLTPRRYQSGETDVRGRISKTGDRTVRAALYEAAHAILTGPVKGGALKSWGQGLAPRAGLKKATVALARKLAVILHRMLADGTPFNAGRGQRHERPGLPHDGTVPAAVNTAFRAADGGGPRPALSAAVRGAFTELGRDGETPFSQTEKLLARRSG
jgi:hypothetical protein